RRERRVLVHIELRLDLISLRLRELRLRLQELTVGLRHLRLGLRNLRVRLLELSLKLRDLAVGLIQRGLKAAGIDLKQQLPFLDERTFFVILSQEIASDLRLDVDVDQAVGRAAPCTVN